MSCSQETEASTDDEFEAPAPLEHTVGRSSTGRVLNRSLSWSATASGSASHQLKRKRSVDSSVSFKKEYKERHPKKGSSSQGPVTMSTATPSQQSNPLAQINLPCPGATDATPTGLNIVSALALLSSSIASEQKGLAWGNLTGLGLGQVVGGSHALNSFGLGQMSSTVASATPTSLSIASMLALLSQSIQAEQNQAASNLAAASGTLDSPPMVAPQTASSEPQFLSPNTLSIASALALLSSSIQAEQKHKQATSSSSPAVVPLSALPEAVGESSTGSASSSGVGMGIAFLSPLVELSRTDCGSSSSSSSSSSSNRPSPSETATDPENDSPSTASNMYCEAGRVPGDESHGRAKELPSASDSNSTLPLMSPVF